MEVGTFVWLKSGSPSMCIEKVHDDGRVDAVWWGTGGFGYEETLITKTLTTSKPDLE